VKLLSFDIEISDVFELGKHEDMEKYAPFHISVAGTAVNNGDERLWYPREVLQNQNRYNVSASESHYWCRRHRHARRAWRNARDTDNNVSMGR
jgi:hypothetical protein